ncbi:hypothetical protein MRBLPE1_003515 [Paenibacillus sp. LPE1-1-1.1]
MKFKAQDKQNQLIENITVHHLVVGADIAQEVHVARAVSFRGVALSFESNIMLLLQRYCQNIYHPCIFQDAIFLFYLLLAPE